MRPICRTLPLLAGVLFCLPFAFAQSGAEVHMGFGSAHASSAGPTDIYGDGTLYNTPELDGFFMSFGGSAMLTPHWGIGGQVSFRPSKGDYTDFKYRPTFYDFNAIFVPVPDAKKVVPEFQAGMGGMNLKFYYDEQSCNSLGGCSNYSTVLASSNHFQLHMGAGVRIFVTPHVFVRPQVDVHWVHNLFQFGSNWVPQYGAAIGYEFGER